jgi:hypothetical protein
MSPQAIQEGIDAANLENVDPPDCNVVDETIDSGGEARCFGQYMRIHALEATGGLTYAEMGRFQSAANPSDPAGTNDEAQAAKTAELGQPAAAPDLRGRGTPTLVGRRRPTGSRHARDARRTSGRNGPAWTRTRDRTVMSRLL